MTVSPTDLINVLSDAGILSANDAQLLHGRLDQDQTLQTLESLAGELSDRGCLTDYQLHTLRSGDGDRLLLGDYLLLEPIGHGGMGEVYRARHLMMKREVAVKLLLASRIDDPDTIQRFKREVRLAARLTHPNIVTALDAGRHGGHYFLVMEFVPGQNLSRYVGQHGPLPVIKAVGCLLQAARGLEFAQQKGIVHRDVKPSNLLLSSDGTVKVLDLGLSRLHSDAAAHESDEGDLDLTGSRHFMGTVNFMAPEQAVHPHEADHRADIYSLGCTLYYLLTGRAPYVSGTAMNRVLAHREAPIPPLGGFRIDIPDELEDIYRRMMAKRPEDRYQSFSDLLADLEHCHAEMLRRATEETQASPPSEESCAAGEARSRGRWMWILLAAVTGGGLLAGAYAVFHDGGSPSAGDAAPNVPPADGDQADLLAGLEIPPQQAEQGWRLTPGGLVTGSASPALLVLDRQLPPRYELRLEATRRDGNGPLALGLPLDDHHCLVNLDGSRGEKGRVSFLGFGPDGRVVQTTQSVELPFDRPVAITCLVTDSRIQIDVGGEAVIDWSGNLAELRLAQGWTVEAPGRLFLGANNDTVFEISRLEARRPGVREGASPSGATPERPQ
ncbi:MAG TPA: serine/threonine-protein kinase [Planctomycetaceae bacterium]|nr:serine/threonine-protein kinase [Planctomycetaceae bacterium]